mmetsp:Transcript_22251/g.45042  ORF Transcript_22251/g.45042 Transcript_22251/m.45042 type:complete len:215 (-) Transcript_22251:124-768(-)
MNYGQRGRDLLLDLKRSDFIPPYNDEGVRSTLQEIHLHYDELTDRLRAAGRSGGRARTDSGSNVADTKPPMESRPAVLLHDAAIRRNKRCLLAYHVHRIDRLRSLRWETAAAALPQPVRALLSEAEADFFAEYDRLASRHGAAMELDLTSDLCPPEEEYATVRVVRKGGLGRIETEAGGSVELGEGTTHYLPRGDVERLVRQGALRQLEGEESL